MYCNSINVSEIYKVNKILESSLPIKDRIYTSKQVEQWNSCYSQKNYISQINSYVKGIIKDPNYNETKSYYNNGYSYKNDSSYRNDEFFYFGNLCRIYENSSEIPTKKNIDRYIDYLHSDLRYCQYFSNDSLYINIEQYKGFIKPTPVFADTATIKLTHLYQNGKSQQFALSNHINSTVFDVKDVGLIDSVQIEYTLPFISDFDSIVITKSDTGKVIDGFKIVSFSDKKIAYVQPDIYTLDQTAYDKTGKALTIVSHAYKNVFDLKEGKEAPPYDELIKSMEKADFDSSLFALGKQLVLKTKLNYDMSTLHIVEYKEDIDRFEIKYNQKVDKITTNVTLRNAYPNQKVILNHSENGTKILDKHGDLILKSPHTRLSFVTNSREAQCSNYIKKSRLKECIGCSTRDTFFYIDISNKELKLLDSAYVRGISDERVAISFHEKKSKAQTSWNTYIYNDKFERVNDKVYLNIADYRDVFVAASHNYTFGILDSNGEEVGDPWYRDISEFRNGIAAVTKDFNEDFTTTTKVGFINTKGEYVVPLIYDHKLFADKEQSKTYQSVNNLPLIEIYKFPQIVCKDGLLGWVDFEDNARLTIPIKYVELRPLIGKNNIVFIALKEGNDSEAYGVINKKQEVIIPFKYSFEQVYEKIFETNKFTMDEIEESYL